MSRQRFRGIDVYISYSITKDIFYCLQLNLIACRFVHDSLQNLFDQLRSCISNAIFIAAVEPLLWVRCTEVVCIIVHCKPFDWGRRSAPLAFATSSASSINAPAPSPMTKPSLDLPNGLDARLDPHPLSKALHEAKPAMGRGAIGLRTSCNHNICIPCLISIAPRAISVRKSHKH